MTEVWKSVVDIPGYEVSSLGRVRSVDRVIEQVNRGGAMCQRRLKGRLLKCKPIAGGYRILNLSQQGTDNHRLVHRLVLEAFVGACPEGMECCHGDSNRAKNALSNLRWDTHQANCLERSAFIKSKRSREEEVNRVVRKA